ncbi:hypothetical protein AO376_0657 [Moraxella catarrhalis]|nr:hypothetical protein AO376_0657 [Moraxella catarrhalis]OAV20879.1 hypothetical protein AO374_0373 [Moraxella catarrhalis]
MPIFIKYADHTVHKASVYLGTILSAVLTNILYFLKLLSQVKMCPCQLF